MKAVRVHDSVHAWIMQLHVKRKLEGRDKSFADTMDFIADTATEALKGTRWEVEN